MAEVLITLGIIGVVASLTMPSLIANHRKEVLKTELKKAYSELQQVNLSFINDEEMNMCEYDWMLVDSGLEVMAASKELSRKFIKYYQGNGEYIYNLGIDNIKTISGGNAHTSYFDDGSVADLRKRTFYFEYGETSRKKCPIITVDINGYYKLPNQLGVDMFAFRPTENGKVIPLGNPSTLNDAANGSSTFTECSKTSTSSFNGMGCAYWAVTDINPEDKTKSYWKDFIK
ncbi:MAG TPA: hypothetical protein IAD11_08595 [Candidatus Stercorousia faecigallinarum]|nr:hypothetical protein [Candidatus Stercorousia faecigallinarum]